MKIHGIVIMIFFYLKTCKCSPHIRIIKDKNISKYKVNTGEPIAVVHLIQEYEKEHLDLFKKEVNESDFLEWKYLENKNLHEYCRRYLYQCVPGRTTCEATGSKSYLKLRYTIPGYEFLMRSIVVVTCTNQLHGKLFYYLTRALETNCVYALNRTQGGFGMSINFTIIYKHCDFELHDYDKNRKRKMSCFNKVHCGYHNDNVKFRKLYMKGHSNRRHETTGQFLADDESIMKYELQHQELCRKEEIEDLKLWPFVKEHCNLSEYCSKYINSCTTNRKVENVEGSWKLQKVKWRSNNEKIEVVVVKCHNIGSSRSYYFTRALATNCVYGLLRDGKQSTDPFLIIFMSCNFDCPNIEQEDLENSEVVNQNVINHVNVNAKDVPTITF